MRQQHRPICNSINRTLTQQRLDCLTESFTACVIIGLCVQWLLQYLFSLFSFLLSSLLFFYFFFHYYSHLFDFSLLIFSFFIFYLISQSFFFFPAFFSMFIQICYFFVLLSDPFERVYHFYQLSSNFPVYSFLKLIYQQSLSISTISHYLFEHLDKFLL